MPLSMRLLTCLTFLCLCACGQRTEGYKPRADPLSDSSPEEAWSSILRAMTLQREQDVKKLLTDRALRKFESVRGTPSWIDRSPIISWYADLANGWDREKVTWTKRGERQAEAAVGSRMKVHTFEFINQGGWKLDYWRPGQ